jgi:hypothetical protein
LFYVTCLLLEVVAGFGVVVRDMLTYPVEKDIINTGPVLLQNSREKQM